MRGDLQGRWETDKLDPNDMGFLQRARRKARSTATSPTTTTATAGRGAFNTGRRGLEGYRSWLYAGNDGSTSRPASRSGVRPRPPPGHAASTFYTEAQHRSFNQGWIFIGQDFDGTSKYETRTYDDQRGPLMTQPGWTNVALGGTTDWRKPLSLNLEFARRLGRQPGGPGGRGQPALEPERAFLPLARLRHTPQPASTPSGCQNYRNDGRPARVPGIGGVDYVFGELDQMIWDLTLRSSILFNRDNSLQLYLQPFLTCGDYANATWLATPDSYDLRPYDIDPGQFDFDYGAVNLNLVYRWEYRPGSTFYLVWTHNKDQYEERGGPDNPDWDQDPAVEQRLRRRPPLPDRTGQHLHGQDLLLVQHLTGPGGSQFLDRRPPGSHPRLMFRRFKNWLTSGLEAAGSALCHPPALPDRHPLSGIRFAAALPHPLLPAQTPPVATRHAADARGRCR